MRKNKAPASEAEDTSQNVIKALCKNILPSPDQKLSSAFLRSLFLANVERGFSMGDSWEFQGWKLKKKATISHFCSTVKKLHGKAIKKNRGRLEDVLIPLQCKFKSQ